MGQFILDYPDGIGARIRDAYCTAKGYQETIDGQPNPEAKIDFVKRMLVEHIKGVVVGQETRDAANTASVSQQATSETEIDITTT